MLKAIRLTPEAVKNAIEKVDSAVLTRHILTELLKFTPTEDDLAQLKLYDASELKMLASAVRHVVNI